MPNPREPTSEECSSLLPIGGGWYACWYPQMGGYVGKAAVFIVDSGCVDMLIWHDGEFPFDGGDTDGWTAQPKEPRSLHHCDVSQFRRLAEDIERIETLRAHAPQEPT